MTDIMALNSVYDQINEQQGVLVDLLNQSRKNPIAPNRLSDVCMKLSVLNGLLGSFVPLLKQDQIEAERRVFNKVKETGKSDTGALAMVRFETVAERLAFETAENRHKDIWKMVSMAQSHIRAESDERKGM